LTNEQIEKRFLFDLEMGRFEETSFDRCFYFKTFVDEFDIDRFQKSKNLISLLYKLGYSINDHNNEVGSVRIELSSETMFRIYTNFKHVEVYKGYQYAYLNLDRPDKIILNRIPDYIKEYDSK